MDKVIKKAFIFIGISIMVLYMTGVFLPMLISTSTIPVTLILVIATTTIAMGFISIYYVVKRFVLEENLRQVEQEKDNYEDHIC